VYIASRSKDKVEEAINLLRLKQPTVDVHFLACDLQDLESVKAAANEFIRYISELKIPISANLKIRKESRLHILVNNAGVWMSFYLLAIS
jgi:NAD(P)-dependent dehydrogenase (short-subunit alcohol dehydrogenase family)